jgi:predicted glycosyltransferase involved in capsule biosynthesis
MCQDEVDSVDTPVQHQLINLKLPEFNKAVMANKGVMLAQSDKIVLLDGDRLLPANYFTKMISRLPKKIIATPRYLFKLANAATDEQINAGVVYKMPDFRYTSKVNFGYYIQTKGMFSGNTVMYRQDYLDTGGMDESFVGYGYSDTDFMFTCEQKKYGFFVSDDEELHLWHPNGYAKADFVALNNRNALKFCKKWNVIPDEARLYSMHFGAIPFA